MDYLFAPMEGITGYVFRNAHHRHFHGIKEYYTPFISPNQTRKLTPRELNDVIPEHNEGIPLIPQILTNKADDFLWAAKRLKELGYMEVNLNLGCPSRTVVTKYRGAGFLAKPDALEQFLEEVYGRINIRLSLKTRLGMEDEDEFEHLLEIYNKFPVTELIIHPRVQTDYYKNKPRMEYFLKALEISKNPVVYNGDIFTEDLYKQKLAQIFTTTVTHAENRTEAVKTSFPESNRNTVLESGKGKQLSAVMLGRGVLANPALFGEIRGTQALTKERLWEFHERLLADYSQEMSGERNVLFKMKELWFYLAWSFENSEKYEKKIRKAQHLSDYRLVVRQLFTELELNA